ncbi:MAG TPA: adenosine deaminase [Gaiellaceae bacterium]|nr:adenosine deaminase [Gaiellaceae bacterium]
MQDTEKAGRPPFPKIELHVHLEATVRPERLLEIARRNDFALPAETPEGIRELYRYRDFDHFIEVWILTTNALQKEEDFRQVVVDYAAEAARHGAVYVEGIFSPIERTWRGVSWDALFSGYCDGVQEARERHGVEVLLTPDVTRGAAVEHGFELVRRAVAYRERGIAGIGLGGEEALYPPEAFAGVFQLAREEGFASVPHAGEVMGPASIRGALHDLGADRIRHGIRAVEDPALLDELAERRVVLDVTPISNLRTGVVKSLAEHPLPELVAAGVPCTVSTDDPEMFDTDLTREYDAVMSLGLDPKSLYDAAVEGALCGDETRERLRRIGAEYDWTGLAAVGTGERCA